MTPGELQGIVESMATEGVPAGVISRVFGLDLDLVKDTVKEVRIGKYGTDDLNDYMEQMQWDAVEVARTTLATGSSTEKARLMSAILGKQMTAAAKRRPEGERDELGKIEEMFAAMRGDDG